MHVMKRMRLETKFLRLPMAVTIGSRFGDWQVCWVGGWAAPSAVLPRDAHPDCLDGAQRFDELTCFLLQHE